MPDNLSRYPPDLRTLFRLASLLAAALCCGSLCPAVKAQGQEEVVAEVGGKKITRRELDDSITAQLFPLEQQAYALRKAALENLILGALIEEEAKRRGLSPEELRRQLTAVAVRVPASQVEQSYLENAPVFASMSPDEAKERIRLDLENQARIRAYRDSVRQLREQAGVRVLLAEPSLSYTGDNRRAQALGETGARVTITEFSDFECPYCRSAQAPLKRVLQEFEGSVRLIFKHLPLDLHRQAFAAARAAHCAGEQGKFWQYHDALFAEPLLTPQSFGRVARDLGLDGPKFQNCLDSEAARIAVLGDLKEARRLGIGGTPTFVINGKMFRGALTYEDLKGVVERELKSSGANNRMN